MNAASIAPPSKWILLTDDSPTVCAMLSKLAAEYGHESICLKNYLELPRLLRKNPPRLVVLDLDRPGGLSGRAIGRFVRNYQVNEIRILVFSSQPHDELEEVSREVGATMAVSKRSDFKLLRNTFVRLLRD